jgi:1-deoxy-D-xylulose-5-phosphate reductoisomerase
MIRRRKVVLLGCTGSIGQSTLKVARELPAHMELVGLAANQNEQALLAQAKECGVRHLALNCPKAAARLRSLLPQGSVLHEGEAGLVDLVQQCGADLLLVAIVGTAGLAPTLAAIELGMDLAIASKEILVMAGEVVMQAARAKGIKVLPIDSEHNAIFQCLEGRPSHEVRRLILTASGGPFRTLPADQLGAVTVEQALRHPTWSMGRKITIDSATLFNKGLEMIEARWLFDIPMPQIEVIVHPQSLVHSMVEFCDHSVLAQLSHSDMCFPIQYAITHPSRVGNQLKPLDFASLQSLHFEAARCADFPALDLARAAAQAAGSMPAVLNAANEVAVERFLQGGCSFPSIWQTVEATMQAHDNRSNPSLEAIIEADRWARQHASARLGS